LRRMTIKKQIVIYMFIVICGLLIINLMVHSYWALRGVEYSKLPFDWRFSQMAFWGFLFGLLIEWQSIKRTLTGHFKINWLFIPTILLLIAVTIPSTTWGFWGGAGGEPYGIKPLSWILEPVQITETRVALSVLSGILLVRSLSSYNK